MKPAISYRRVSTEDQAEYGYGLPAQLEDIQGYAARNGLRIVEDIAEDASGMTWERPGLQRALALLRSGEAKVMICRDNSRLTRDSLHAALLRREFRDHGIEVHYSTRGRVDFTNFGDRMTDDIFALIAEHDREEFIRRTNAAKRTKIRTTGMVIVNGRPPYGYECHDGRLVICEEEAAIVRLIFHLYTIGGLTLTEIADHLTVQGVPTFADRRVKGFVKKRPVGTWGHTAVRKILRNETYAGVWHYRKQARREQVQPDGSRKKVTYTYPREEWIAAEVPDIVDRATWEKAQELLKLNKIRAARNTKHDYLMAKRITCECGLMMRALIKDGKYPYYYCASQHKKERGLERTCGLPYFRLDRVDEAVWRWVKRILSDPDYLTELLSKSQQARVDKSAGLKSELAEIDNKIDQKERESKNLLRKFAGSNDQDVLDVRDEIKAEVDRLQRRALEIKQELGRASAIDQTIALARSTTMFQAGLLRDDEPFPVRMKWIMAFNVTAIARVFDGKRQLVVQSEVGTDVLDIDVTNATVCDFIWQITDVLELSDT